MAVVALTASLSLAITGCAGGGKGGGQQELGKGANTQAFVDVPRDQVKDGGKMTTMLQELSPQMNTFHGDGTTYTRQVWNWYNPMMMAFSKEGEWSFNKDYLTDVKEETVEGKTRITYTINPKATYNDGTPIDWRSFETVWKTSSGKNEAFQPSSTDGYERIESVARGADDKQAVVTFGGPWAWWKGLFNYVEHPALADPEVFNKAYVEKPNEQWGAGPYTVDSYDKQNQTISFKRNDKWWGEKGKLDSKIFKGMANTASFNAFKAGEIDGVGATTKEALGQVSDVPDTVRHSAPATSVNLLGINSRAEKLKDVKVREAIVTAIDREQIKQIAFQGTDYSEPPMGSLSLFSFQKGYSDNFGKVVPKTDPDRAGRLLDEAGWTKGADGIREKDGQKLNLVLPNVNDTANAKARMQAIQAQLKNVGIAVDVQQRPSSEFSNIFSKKQYDIFLMGITQSDPYGMAYFGQVWSTKGSLNVGGVGSPEFDKKIEQLGNIADPDAQIAKGNELEVEGFKQFGIMPLYMGPSIVVAKKGMVNTMAAGGQVTATQYWWGYPENTGWLKE